MDGSAIGDYLRARREQVRPEQVGLTTTGIRRVPGLRREEVAALAGISPEYYLRLEQGRDHQPSDQVIRALSRALQLDVPAAEYLHRLAHPDAPIHLPRVADVVDPGILHLIEQWTTTPAMVISSCQDVLAVNSFAQRYAPEFFYPGFNLVFGVFMPSTKEAAPDWEWLASRTVAALRMAASPDDSRLIAIVGELSIRDADFRRLWARHDVEPLACGPSATWIEGYGLVEVRWQNLMVPGSNGQIITVFYGEPGSFGEEVLRAVASRPVTEPAQLA